MKMRRCASLTAQSQLLHCHAYDTVRARGARQSLHRQIVNG
jgi:hypothetical protein